MYFLPHSLPRNSIPLKRGRPGRTPTAVSAAVHGSVLFRVSMAFHTLHTEGFGDLINDFVFAVSHCRRGRQLACLLGFSLAHLLKLRTLAEVLKKEILLCFGTVLINDAAHLFCLRILRLRLGEQHVFRAAALVGNRIPGIYGILVIWIRYVAVDLCLKQGIAQLVLVTVIQKSMSIIIGELSRAIQFGLGAENPACVTDLKNIAVDYQIDYNSLQNTGIEEDDDND